MQRGWKMDIAHRKVNKIVRVLDAEGRPLKNTAIKVSQTNHKFLFGCGAFDTIPYVLGEEKAFKDALKDPSKQDKIKNYDPKTVVDSWLEVFNYGTLPFYWGQYEPVEGQPQQDSRMKAAQFLQSKNVKVKGHPLCWHTVCADWLMKYDNETIIDKKEPTVIVQTGEFLNNLGKLNVKFDAKGVVKEANGQLIALDKLAEDAGAVEILKPYKAEIAEMNNQEIGVTLATALETPRDGGDDTKPSVRKNQTILGNIITDGMLKKAKEVAKPYNKNIVMAFTNGGGIRAAINAGPVTLGEVRTVLPFGNTLATIVPLVVLYSSRATAWFDSLGPRNGTNWGLVCFMLVVLGGFVLPSFTIARPINADTCAQAMRGRNLFVMQTENRQSHESDTSVPLVDLSSCSSSEEYVRGLFAANGDNDTNELARSVRQWTFVVNVPEDAPNTFPVMFSANFDPSVLPREWDGKAEADKILKIMPIEGVEPLKFGDKAVVVVRKGGVSQVIRKEYCRLDVLFCRQPYRFAENTYFLSPVGKIDTKGSK